MDQTMHSTPEETTEQITLSQDSMNLLKTGHWWRMVVSTFPNATMSVNECGEFVIHTNAFEKGFRRTHKKSTRLILAVTGLVTVLFWLFGGFTQ